MTFQDQFRAARRVSTPIVAIRTFDATSTIHNVRLSLNGKVSDTPLLSWDAAHGMRPLNEKGTQDLSQVCQSLEATVVLVESLRMIESISQDAIVFVHNAHLHWTDSSVIQAIWNLRDLFKSNGNMLILMCSPGAVLPPELTNDVLVLDEPLPTANELSALVNDTYKCAKLEKPDADTVAKAVDALLGLPSFSAEQSLAMCLDVKSANLDISRLWERKRQIISQTPGLSLWNGNETLNDIGGIEAVKTFCRRVVEGKYSPRAIIFIDEIEKAFAGTGTDLSGVKTELTGSMLSWMQDKEIDGLIFIGLPGVSKSALAKALGNTYAIPTINFDIAGMQSGLVGASGANLRAAQKTVDAISGGRVLAIATCNSIHSLPPELRRRFNLGIFFFDAPTAEERAAIWNIYRKKYNIPEDDKLPNDVGWTGAEIKECCKKAYCLNLTLIESAQYIVPITCSSAEHIRTLRTACSGKYLSASKPGLYTYSESSDTMITALPVVVSSRKIRDNEVN